MAVFRVIGWALVVIGLALLAWDVARWVEGAPFAFLTGGELWFNLHRASLNMLQAGVQRRIAPELWDPVIVTVLLWPAWLTIGGFGLILALLFRRRR